MQFIIQKPHKDFACMKTLSLSLYHSHTPVPSEGLLVSDLRC